MKKKMQAVRYNSAPSVSLLHACYQNANTSENTKEHWVHANSVNQLLRCKQACRMQNQTQQGRAGSDKKRMHSIHFVRNVVDLTSI